MSRSRGQGVHLPLRKRLRQCNILPTCRTISEIDLNRFALLFATTSLAALPVAAQQPTEAQPSAKQPPAEEAQQPPADAHG